MKLFLDSESRDGRMMLDHPESSNAAYLLQVLVMTVIVLSTISAATRPHLALI